jgi:hypothetical protein
MQSMIFCDFLRQIHIPPNGAECCLWLMMTGMEGCGVTVAQQRKEQFW